MLVPIILPTAISNSPLRALLTVINISGRDVPITIAVIVIIFSLIFKCLAMIVALFTITSLLKEIAIIERISKVIHKGILSYLA